LFRGSKLRTECETLVETAEQQAKAGEQAENGAAEEAEALEEGFPRKKARERACEPALFPPKRKLSTGLVVVQSTRRSSPPAVS
jgi:hypothetical protein